MKPKLYRRSTVAAAAFFAIVLCFGGVSSLLAHTLIDNTNARVEVTEEYAPHTVEGVRAIFASVPGSTFLSGGGIKWVWGGISATDQFYGDCHSGEISSNHLTAVRVGWIKINNSGFTPAQEMVAYFTNTGSIKLITGAIHNQEKLYTTRRLTGSTWDYNVGSLNNYIYDGPSQNMKCATFGGWAKNSSLPFSTVKIRNPQARQSYNWQSISAATHAVRHSSYSFDPPFPPLTQHWFFRKN